MRRPLSRLRFGAFLVLAALCFAPAAQASAGFDEFVGRLAAPGVNSLAGTAARLDRTPVAAFDHPTPQAAQRDEKRREAARKMREFPKRFFGEGILGWLLLGLPYVAITWTDVFILGVVFILVARMAGSLVASRREHLEEMKNKEAYKRAVDDWRRFADRDETEKTAEAERFKTLDEKLGPDVIRKPEFDEEAFLDGTKAVYRRLYADIEDGRIDEAKQFLDDEALASPELLSRIPRSPRKSPAIQSVEASLVEINLNAVLQRAVVRFVVVFEVQDDADRGSLVENWRFVRDRRDESSRWLVESLKA